MWDVVWEGDLSKMKIINFGEECTQKLWLVVAEFSGAVVEQRFSPLESRPRFGRREITAIDSRAALDLG